MSYSTVIICSRIEEGAYAILFDALPYRFYCILMIVFVLVNVISGIGCWLRARGPRPAVLCDLARWTDCVYRYLCLCKGDEGRDE